MIEEEYSVLSTLLLVDLLSSTPGITVVVGFPFTASPEGPSGLNLGPHVAGNTPGELHNLPGEGFMLVRQPPTPRHRCSAFRPVLTYRHVRSGNSTTTCGGNYGFELLNKRAAKTDRRVEVRILLTRDHRVLEGSMDEANGTALGGTD
jgi:hypothetical protein